MSCFAKIQERTDEWNVVLQFLDARDWMRMKQPAIKVTGQELAAAALSYRAKRILTNREQTWFRVRKIPVYLLETSVSEVGLFQMWHQNGKYHRDDDQPAIIWGSGSQEWYQKGWRHRDGDRPAIIYGDGTQEWRQNGWLHRDGDRPAIIYGVGANGRQEWYQNGQLHRDGDRPAVIEADGRQSWYRRGLRHRDGGRPARVWADGRQEWHQNGRLYMEGRKVDTTK